MNTPVIPMSQATEDRQMLLKLQSYLTFVIDRVEHERKTFMPMATDLGKEQMAKDLLKMMGQDDA
tara:strand:+ start:527 stop:721 length:195 start_codon:yes stop_codon:yes gene_type:complete